MASHGFAVVWVAMVGCSRFDGEFGCGSEDGGSWLRMVVPMEVVDSRREDHKIHNNYFVSATHHI